MTVRSFPHLGWDPTPGDVERTRAVGRQVSQLASELGSLVRELDGMDDGTWRGLTADAFREEVGGELEPLLTKTRDLFDGAGIAVEGWAGKLDHFQHESRMLEQEAARRQEAMQAASRAAMNAPPGADRAMVARLENEVTQARTAVTQVQQHADDLHQRYLDAARAVARNLEDATGIAPDEPNWLEATINAVTSKVGEFLEAAGEWIREHAELIEFISNVLSTISAIAGLLAFIPPLSAIMAPIALVAAAGATLGEGLLLMADAKNASWKDFGLNAVGVVAGFGALKAGGKIVDAFYSTRRVSQLRTVRTVTGGTKEVAPGMFSMAKNGASMTRTEVGWRMVKLKSDQASLAITGYQTPGMVSNSRRWVENTAAGRGPWAQTGRPSASR